MYESEFEGLAELESEWEGEWEGEGETEAFFGRIASAASRGWNWLTTPGSTQRRVAINTARAAAEKGLPAVTTGYGAAVGGILGGLPSFGIGAAPGAALGGALGGAVGYPLGGFLGGFLPEREDEGEFEWALEGEANPLRRVYPDALMEHLGRAAAAAQNEGEAEAFIGAMIPVAASLAPRVAPALLRVAPNLVAGAAGAARVLRDNPQMRPLVRTLPSIVRRTVGSIAQQAAQGRAVTPQMAVRTLAGETRRVLSNPQFVLQAYRRSQALDRRFHRAAARRGAQAVV
ncbi:MAG: hypothetical protein RKK15_09865 [Defluviicoccus sp.]|nr:hypothetical protein [Defluviicoccus sp.]